MRTLFRMAALTLLALIAIDIQDAGCDPVPELRDRTISARSPEATGDPCSGSCVPDCFCCSPTLPALAAFGIETPQLAPETPHARAVGAIGGTPLAQDHVPKRVL